MNHNRGYGWIALGALLAVSGARADTRIDSLASDPRLTEDLDVIWMYPNKVLEYQGTADFRFNNGAAAGLANPTGYGSEAAGPNAANQYEWGGVIDGRQKDIGVLGVYVNRPFAPLFPTVYGGYWRPVGGTTAWGSSALPGGKVDLFWAQSYGPMDLGVRLNYGDMQNSGADYARTAGLEAGVGVRGDGVFNEADFHAGYAFGSFQNGATGVRDKGIYSLDAGALLQHDMDENDNLRFFADGGRDQYRDTAGTADFSQTLLALGLGLNHGVQGGKGLLSTGLAVQSRAANAFYNVVVGWNGSAEAALADWMTLRVGLYKPLFDRLTTGGVTSDPTVPNTVVFSTGAGFRWENWSLEARISVPSLEHSLQNPEPGNGIAFTESSNSPIVAVTEIDLHYLF